MSGSARSEVQWPASPTPTPCGPTATLAARIVEERGSLLHLYAMLLHSPSVAEGWLGFLTAIRQKSMLPGSIR